MKKIYKKINQKEFRIEKVIKRKEDKLYAKWKGYDSSFKICINKKRHNINEWIFSRSEIFRKKSEVELDLSNYATKVDLKNATGVNT